MSDKLLTKKVLLETYDQFEVNGKKKYELKTSGGQFTLWETNIKGEPKKAFEQFCAIPALSCPVEIGYVEWESNGYRNTDVRFIHVLDSEQKEKSNSSLVDNSLEQRMTALESRVTQLESRTVQPAVETSVEDLASQFGGTVVSQTPMPQQGSTNVSNGIVGSGENGEVRVEDIPF